MPLPKILPEYVYKIVDSEPPSPIPEVLAQSELDKQDGFVHLSTSLQVSSHTLLQALAHSTFFPGQHHAVAGSPRVSDFDRPPSKKEKKTHIQQPSYKFLTPPLRSLSQPPSSSPLTPRSGSSKSATLPSPPSPNGTIRPTTTTVVRTYTAASRPRLSRASRSSIGPRRGRGRMCLLRLAGLNKKSTARHSGK